MKNNIDIYTLVVGLISAILKGIKKNFSARTLIISALSGSMLALGSLGLAMYFLESIDVRMAIFIAFVVGWVSSEITDALEKIVKDVYDILKVYLQTKIKKK